MYIAIIHGKTFEGELSWFAVLNHFSVYIFLIITTRAIVLGTFWNISLVDIMTMPSIYANPLQDLIACSTAKGQAASDKALNVWI